MVILLILLCFLLEKDGQLEKSCIISLCKAKFFGWQVSLVLKMVILTFLYEEVNNFMIILMQVSNC